MLSLPAMLQSSASDTTFLVSLYCLSFSLAVSFPLPPFSVSPLHLLLLSLYHWLHVCSVSFVSVSCCNGLSLSPLLSLCLPFSLYLSIYLSIGISVYLSFSPSFSVSLYLLQSLSSLKCILYAAISVSCVASVRLSHCLFDVSLRCCNALHTIRVSAYLSVPLSLSLSLLLLSLFFHCMHEAYLSSVLTVSSYA